LVAFDLDGTLIRGRTCVDSIASAIGREDECARFERLFERLDLRDVAGISAAREEMATWYRPYTTEELTADLPNLALAPGTKEAFALLRARCIVTAIISTTWSFAAEWLARQLGADYAHGTRLVDGLIEHVWPADKGEWLRELIERLDLSPREVAAVGDSEGDRELFEAAAMRCCVGERKVDVARVIHLPNANMLAVAKRLVGQS
jgi:HAD superfamily phosphoserine phosphatase-like hydrolase